MVFSHGLGGSRNAYSHITGSLASHGMVVVAAEHRDSSCPISYIHSTDGSAPKIVPYLSLPHDPRDPEVERGRNKQLRIRLWELGLIHDALLKIANKEAITNIATDGHYNISEEWGFHSLIDVHTPGKISWSGHSFGAATIVAFTKSVYYPPPTASEGYEPLYNPSANSPISRQITPQSPIALLDLWSLPLISSATSWLRNKPLPAYDSPNSSAPLAVLSEAFFKWTSNLRETKAVISSPGSQISDALPHLFYPIASAHLSQSDFGPLFPWLTRKVFKTEDPERTMRLNVRAILENLRRSGIQVADTSIADMELTSTEASSAKAKEDKGRYPLSQDHHILATDGSVKGWVAIPLDGKKMHSGANGHSVEADNPGEAVLEGEVMKSEL